MTIETIFKELQTKSIEETLKIDGLKFIQDKYVDDIDYDTEGETIKEINEEFSILDKDLSELKTLKYDFENKQLELNNEIYPFDTLEHLFFVKTDWEDGSEKGIIYLKLVNDVLVRNNTNKIAFSMYDSINDCIFAFCIAELDYFEKLKKLVKYTDNLRFNNREEGIKIIMKNDTRRDIEFFTNYMGEKILFGVTMLMEE